MNTDTNPNDPIWCGLPWPPPYDPELDSSTPQGKARREREAKSLQEHLAKRAQYYADHPDEIDIDAVVERYYDRMFRHVYG